MDRMVKWCIRLGVERGSIVVVNGQKEDGSVLPLRCKILDINMAPRNDDEEPVSPWDSAEVHDLVHGETYDVPLQLCRPEGMTPEDFEPLVDEYVAENPMTEKHLEYAKEGELVEAAK